MESKVLQVFYGKDCLPYKDKNRSVHFPIVGNAFQGANNTTEIRFYFDKIGGADTTWIAVSKLPNGKIGSKILTTHYDGDLGEDYALLELSSFYTQYKGDVYISLQGYNGGVTYDFDENQEIYQIHGTPTIRATGSVKLAINYATQFVGSGEEENITLQEIFAELAQYLKINNGIVVINKETADISSYDENQIFYDIVAKHFYRKIEDALVSYDIVPFNQASVSVIIDPLTNINGRRFTHYTSQYDAINGYYAYRIKYDGNNSTEEQAREYMSYMTGSNYLPKYYYNRPANTFLLMPNGQILKPQYDATNGLVLYIMSRLAMYDYVHDNYVPSIDVTSILTAQEVYNLVGANYKLFSYSVDDNLYFAMFVPQTSGYTLIVFGETSSFETDIFTLNALFRDIITNENLRYSSVPVVSISSGMTTLNPSQMAILEQNNSCISYSGRTYFKAHDSGTSIEFVCVDYDKAVSNGSNTLTKYEISVNKTTRQTSQFNEYLYVYDKAQIDSKIATIYNELGASIDLSIDSNFDLVVKLLNQNGEVLSQGDVDLPLESIVVSATYYDTYTYGGTTYNQVLVIVLATTPTPTIIPIGQLVSGLEKEAFIQVDNIGTPLTSDQLTIANLPNARIKYGNNYFIKANDNGTNIVFANLLIGVSENSGVYTLEKQTLTVTKASGQMVTTTSYTTFYSKDQVDTLLGAKANASDVYTKAESDATFRTENQVDQQINTKISGLSRTNLIEDYEENKQYDYKYIVTQDGELVMRLTEIE